MGIASDIKTLGEDIVASYDVRVKAVGEVVKDTHKMLREFQAEHKEMAGNLKSSLEEGEMERLKVFKAMMQNVGKDITDIEKHVAKKLKEFTDAHADMSGELKKALARYVADMVKSTKNLMSDIQKRQKERNTEDADLLAAYNAEREKMAVNWQALTDTMARRRGGKPVVAAAAGARTVGEAVKEVKKAKKAKRVGKKSTGKKKGGKKRKSKKR